ncbi:MAG: heavy-metal-associated domain-containing protein [Elusimicrobia bacterium]|nr:heavy-metal-associated domain-containing protein [Elusimicrobiota bacterium]
MGPRLLLLALLAAAAPAAGAAASETVSEAPPAPAKSARRFAWLKPGVYESDVQGMICSACAGAIVEELRRVSGLEEPAVDFERRSVRFVVGARRSIHVNTVKRALARASRRIDLGGGFGLGEIRYVP